MKTYKLSEAEDIIIGEKGSHERDVYEANVRIELLGYEIRKIRKNLNLTQSQLGEKIGVKKAQISKLENNTASVNISTLINVFRALGKDVRINLLNI